jgi:hypothetical protein
VLAWLCVHAFARIAGLNRVHGPRSRLLPVLGAALPSLIVADIAEDAASWLVIASSGGDPLLAPVFGLVMSVAALAKYVALAGVVALTVWGYALIVGDYALRPRRSAAARVAAAGAEDEGAEARSP